METERRKFDGSNPVKQVKVHVREKDLELYTRTKIESLIELDKSGTLRKASDVVGAVLPDKVPVSASNEEIRLKREFSESQEEVKRLRGDLDKALADLKAGGWKEMDVYNGDAVLVALLRKVSEKYNRCSPVGKDNLVRDIMLKC